MSKYKELKVSEIAKRLQYFGVDLASYQQSMDEVLQPASAAQWMQKITASILSHESLVMDLRIGKKNLDAKNALSVNQVFDQIDAAHSWVVNHAYNSLKEACPIGAMYSLEQGKLVLNIDQSCLFMRRDDEGYESWASDFEFDDENNIIKEPSEPAPTLDWTTRSGMVMSNNLQVTQELLTAFQWIRHFFDYKKPQLDDPKFIIDEYAITQEYLKNSTGIVSSLHRYGQQGEFYDYIEIDLFNPFKEPMDEKERNNIWRLLYRYSPKLIEELSKENSDIENGPNNGFANHIVWKYFDGTNKKQNIHEIEKEIEKFNYLVEHPGSENPYDYHCELEELKKEHTKELCSSQITAIYPKLPLYFLPLLRYANYYSLNGHNCLLFEKGFQPFFYSPLHITHDGDNFSRLMWTGRELKERSDALLTAGKILETVLAKNIENLSEAEQRALDAVREVVALFQLLGKLLISLFYEESQYCAVCYRTKLSRMYCSDHTGISKETAELRWANKIFDDYMVRFNWHQKECFLFQRALLTEPAKELERIKLSSDSLTYSLAKSFEQFNKVIGRKALFDIQKVQKESFVALNSLSCQLNLLRTILIHPLDKKMKQLFALILWEHSQMQEALSSNPDILHRLRKIEEIKNQEMPTDLTFFANVWYTGLPDYYIKLISYSSKELIKHADFKWIVTGFDKYSQVVEQSKAINFHGLVNSLMRQSAWMNVDLVLQSDPTVAKIEASKIFELYEQGMSLGSIGIQLSPTDPLSESTVLTTLHRYVANNITSDLLIEAVSKTAVQRNEKIHDLNVMSTEFKKQVGKVLTEKLGYKMSISAASVSLAIKKLTKKTPLMWSNLNDAI